MLEKTGTAKPAGLTLTLSPSCIVLHRKLPPCILRQRPLLAMCSASLPLHLVLALLKYRESITSVDALTLVPICSHCLCCCRHHQLHHQAGMGGTPPPRAYGGSARPGQQQEGSVSGHTCTQTHTHTSKYTLPAASPPALWRELGHKTQSPHATCFSTPTT